MTAVPVIARPRRLRWESIMRVLCQDLGDVAGAARHDLQVLRSLCRRPWACSQGVLARVRDPNPAPHLPQHQEWLCIAVFAVAGGRSTGRAGRQRRVAHNADAHALVPVLLVQPAICY